MNELHDLNKYIFEEYMHLPNREELSIPLLISSNSIYTNNLNRKILYIGQETNCWMNYDDEKFIPSVKEIENTYYNFLKNGARNREYWKFIRKALNIKSNELVNNVIWNNVFIAGKRTEIGCPYNEKLEDLSIEYLLEVTKILNPEYTIFVSGPKNPYYSVVIKYLKEMKSKLINEYPTVDNPIINDEKIIWTYHPTFQNRSHLRDKVLEKTRNLVNN